MQRSCRIRPKIPCRHLSSTRNSDILTLLHKTTPLVPRVLPPSEHTQWTDALSNTSDDLTSSQLRPVRITVWGTGQAVPSKGLVDALILDPFGDKESLKREQRQHGFFLSENTQSPFFRRYTIPVNVLEVTDPSQLLNADVPVLVADVEDSQLRASLPSTTIRVLAPAVVSKYSDIIPADPERALKAIEFIASDPHSPLNVQRFQDGFVGSNVPQVLKAIDACLLRETSLRAEEILALVKRRTAIAQLSHLFSSFQASLTSATTEIQNAQTLVRELHSLTETESAQAEKDVLGASLHHTEKILEQGDAKMKALLDGLTWWRMVRRVDEVGDAISSAVSRTWCKELEQDLIFHTGRLAQIQRTLAHTTFTILSAKPSRPLTYPVFPTAVLENKLRQLEASSSYPITPSALTAPIEARRTQLIAYPTPTLHRAAQRSFLNMLGGLAAGSSISWAGWIGSLAGGESLFTWFDPSTTIGAGFLVTAVCVRLAVKGWEKAKRAWWADWKRVRAGLERDLDDRLHSVLEYNVLLIPRSAAQELDKSLTKRKGEVEVLTEEIARVEEELQQIKSNNQESVKYLP